jgi:uncharacterized damage-inducible protein DinB
MNIPKPKQDTYPPYYSKYISLVPSENLLQELLDQLFASLQVLENITEEKSSHAYAHGKWTIKELLKHVIDTERIFCFRALSIARGEIKNIPGFDENEYVKNSNANLRKFSEIREEFIAVRTASISLVKGFTDDVFHHSGIANGNRVNVSAICYMIVGHEIHHRNILIERYLS